MTLFSNSVDDLILKKACTRLWLILCSTVSELYSDKDTNWNYFLKIAGQNIKKKTFFTDC